MIATLCYDRDRFQGYSNNDGSVTIRVPIFGYWRYRQVHMEVWEVEEALAGRSFDEEGPAFSEGSGRPVTRKVRVTVGEDRMMIQVRVVGRKGYSEVMRISRQRFSDIALPCLREWYRDSEENG